LQGLGQDLGADEAGGADECDLHEKTPEREWITATIEASQSGD
jgi:hypothetical protein